MSWAVMIKPKDIRSQKFTADDKILLDANVWLFLQGPPGDPKDDRVAIYSRAFADMLAAKCLVIVNALIMSEFVNRFARLQFGLVKKPAENFKDFRNSPDFKPIAAWIAEESRCIFYVANRIECGFSSLNHTDLLNAFESGGADFNDLIIADICRRNNYTLVTHDGDFCNSEFSILTANNKLLKS